MKPESKSAYATRESILKLLSDAELARVSTAEAGPPIGLGDEFVDLDHLNKGVQRAPATMPAMGSLLPRVSVQASTWRTILAKLPAARVG